MWIQAALLWSLTVADPRVAPLEPLGEPPIVEAPIVETATLVDLGTNVPPEFPPDLPIDPAAELLRFAAGHPVPETPYAGAIYRAARRAELSPRLLVAVIQVESSFNAQARSRKGACGLMQLLPSTARRFGVNRRQLFHPEHNLAAGAKYLRWLSDRFAGDLPLVLAAYNAGEGSVSRHGGVPPYRETQNYVRRIYQALGLELPDDIPGLGLALAQIESATGVSTAR